MESWQSASGLVAGDGNRRRRRISRATRAPPSVQSQCRALLHLRPSPVDAVRSRLLRRVPHPRARAHCYASPARHNRSSPVRPHAYGFVRSFRYVADHGSATAPVLGIFPHLPLGPQVGFRRWFDSAIRVTVTGGNTSYNRRVNSAISFSAGLDFRRDSPRNAELAHADASGVFQPVTRNDFTISDLAPYASVEGAISRFVIYSAGVRHDALSFSNTDRLTPADSYETGAGLTSPRGTLSFRVPNRSHLPVLTFSSGKAFHTNAPRIGLG